MFDKYVIVRSRDAGVFAGYLVSQEGQEVELKDARRIYYWDGAATLSELSQKGVSRPQNCKFPAPIPAIGILDACEIIPVSAEAKKSIADVPVWTEHE